MKTNGLIFASDPGVVAENAGLFISPGCGMHPDRVLASHELIFVRSGTLAIEEEGRAFEVELGETLLLRAGRRHRGLRAYRDDLSFYWLHFRLPEGVARRRGKANIPQHTRPLRADRLTELMHRFIDDQESGEGSREQAGLLVALMLHELSRDCPAATSSSNNVLAAQAERFIASRFARGLHAGDVAKALGCNLDYLGRVYRRVFGHTLSGAIHRRQLAEARALLRESVNNMEEVARDCGFVEPHYFRKLFSQHHGISPRAYRRLHSRLHVNMR